MQGPAWVALLRRIPPAIHNRLIAVMTTGTAIWLQDSVRLERDYAAVRGRMAGTQETGRVLILPFDQITYLAFAKNMTEPEIQTVLGKPGALPAVVEAPPEEPAAEP